MVQALHQKLLAFQQVEKFPVLYETQKLNALFTEYRLTPANNFLDVMETEDFYSCLQKPLL